ncbi:MAG: rhomboid family intramembrane serine protease [Verrucomicrobia bacterium]|nr:rhomboid family intramembrane serine protease [Verrucomicrobiota bacterium]
MRLLTTFEDSAKAQSFGDYLLTQGITNNIEQDESQHWSLWVHEEDQINLANQHLEDFRRNPGDERFTKASSKAASIRARKSREDREFNRRIKDGRTIFHKFRSFSAGPVTIVFLFLCGAIFILQKTDGEQGARIFNILGMASIGSSGLEDIFMRGQIWRLITPALMHGGILHIFFNCSWLKYLGGMVEDRLGSRFLVLAILGIAVVSNFSQYAVSGPFFLGFSGVNYGLFGFIWVMSRMDTLSGFHLQQSTIILMVCCMVLGILGLFGSGIANWAHLGGFFAGAAMGWGRAKFLPT